MNQKNHAVARKNNVWLAGQILAMKTESVAHPVEDPPNRDFRRRVARTDARHHGAALRVDLSHGAT
jgi:hypothetical protein